MPVDFWSPDDVELLPAYQLEIPQRNPRIHNRRQIEMLMESISQFGFVVPLVIDLQDVVVSGAGRLEAARRLGMEYVPVIRASELTETQLRAFNIVDNRLHEMSDFNKDALDRMLQSLHSDGVVLDDWFDAAIFKYDQFQVNRDFDTQAEPVSDEDATKPVVVNAPVFRPHVYESTATQDYIVPTSERTDLTPTAVDVQNEPESDEELDDGEAVGNLGEATTVVQTPPDESAIALITSAQDAARAALQQNDGDSSIGIAPVVATREVTVSTAVPEQNDAVAVQPIPESVAANHPLRQRVFCPNCGHEFEFTPPGNTE